MRELNASFYQFFFRLDALLLEYSWQGTCLFEMAAGRKNAYVMILCDKIRFWWCVRGGGGLSLQHENYASVGRICTIIPLK